MYGKRLNEIDKIDLEKVTGKELLDLKKEIGKKKIASATVAVAEVVAATLAMIYLNKDVSIHDIKYLDLVRTTLEAFGGFVYLEYLINGLEDFRKCFRLSYETKEEIERRVDLGEGEDEITKQ